MRNFLDRQLEQLGAGLDAATRARLFESGLELDLLAFHTTALGTTERRTRAEIAANYGHVESSLLNLMLSRLDALNLLSLPAGEVASEPRRSLDELQAGAPAGEAETALRVIRLAHDLLAPLVRETFDNSDLPGQRSRRLIETRIRDASAQANLPEKLEPEEREKRVAAWIRANPGNVALSRNSRG